MLTLYHHPCSPCSAKVRIVLAEKRIAWEGRIVNLFRGEQFAPPYLAINPAAVVPTLVSDERIVRESLVICEYLEEAFPESSLVPANFVARARMRVWCKDVETFMATASVGVTFPGYERFEVQALADDDRESYFSRHPNRRLAERKRGWIEHGYATPEARNAVLTYHKFLQKMEMQLGKGLWLAGDSYSLADAETTPYLAMLEMLNYQNWWRGRLPRVEDWYDRVKNRRSFTEAIFHAVPAELRLAINTHGTNAWADVDAIIGTAEPFTGKSPWAMRAEAL